MKVPSGLAAARTASSSSSKPATISACAEFRAAQIIAPAYMYGRGRGTFSASGRKAARAPFSSTSRASACASLEQLSNGSAWFRAGMPWSELL